MSATTDWKMPYRNDTISFLCSAADAVSSSRPAPSHNGGQGPGQGWPKATASRREAALTRVLPTVSLGRDGKNGSTNDLFRRKDLTGQTVAPCLMQAASSQGPCQRDWLPQTTGETLGRRCGLKSLDDHPECQNENCWGWKRGGEISVGRAPRTWISEPWVA